MAASTKNDHPENTPAGQKAKEDAVKADSSVGSGPQEMVDKETEQGFRGVEVDPTPNENYTLAGVTSGAPTPETDKGAAKQAAEAQDGAAVKAAGVGER
jgi:hypothetical protein